MTTAIVGQRQAVVQWEQEMKGAQMLMRSGLLPASIKSPEAALFIILAGRDLGLSPVQSLRSIHVIQGKIEVAADMQLGLFHRAGGRSQWTTLTNDKAVLVLHAPWLVEPHVETFTLEDAKRAKLGGDNWIRYPKAMLRSRAITAGLKSVGFDPTAGVYAEGEIGGPEPEIVEEPQPGYTVEQVPLEPGDAEEIEAEPGVVETVGQTDDLEDATVALERRALADIRQMLPKLAPNQRDYVNDQLRDGADVVKLAERIKEVMLMAPAP